MNIKPSIAIYRHFDFQKIIPSLIGVLLLIFSEAGHVTRTHYQPVALAEVVERADLVAIVHADSPFLEYESISILPEGSSFQNNNVPPYFEPAYHDEDVGDQLNRNYPPFKKAWMTAVVDEVLLDNSGEVSAGMKLRFTQGSSGFLLDLHRSYYLDGRRRSPVIQEYQGMMDGFQPESDGQFIIFLNKSLQEWSYVVMDANEHITALDSVKKQLRLNSIQYPHADREEVLKFVDGALSLHGNLEGIENFETGLAGMIINYTVSIEEVGSDSQSEEALGYQLILISRQETFEVSFVIDKLTQEIRDIYTASIEQPDFLLFESQRDE